MAPASAAMTAAAAAALLLGSGSVPFALAWEAAEGQVGWRRSSSPPPWDPHTGSLAVALPGSDRVLLIAGQAGEHGGALFDCFNCTNEVWSFEPKTEAWENLSADVPWDPRWGHSTAVTTDGTVWMLFGCCERGKPTVMLRDVWTFNLAKGVPWTRMETRPPFEGIQATSVALRGDEELWVVGGWSQHRGTLSQVAVLSTKTLEWTVKSDHGKAPWRHRADHATAISSDGRWLYLYAGQHLDTKSQRWYRLKDTWRVSLPAARPEDWQQLSDLNAARSSVPVVAIQGGWLLALGGHFVPDDEELKVKQEDVEGMKEHHRKSEFRVYNDVSALRIDSEEPPSWRLIEEDAPWPARDDCAGVVTNDGDILLFGGGTMYGGGGYLHDVWRLPDAAGAYKLASLGGAGGHGGEL